MPMSIQKTLSKAWQEVVITTKLKASHAKQDKRLVVLLALEFLFTAVLVVSVLIYLNPSVDLPKPFSASFEGRVFFFVLISAAVLYLYSLTSDYRKKRHNDWQKAKKEFLGK